MQQLDYGVLSVCSGAKNLGAGQQSDYLLDATVTVEWLALDYWGRRVYSALPSSRCRRQELGSLAAERPPAGRGSDCRVAGASTLQQALSYACSAHEAGALQCVTFNTVQALRIWRLGSRAITCWTQLRSPNGFRCGGGAGGRGARQRRHMHGQSKQHSCRL